MMTVVCDASPLIFLAKLDRLGLIRGLLGKDVVVLQCVVDEVLGAEHDHVLEQKRLKAFLKSVRTIAFAESSYKSGRLSASDRQTLTYAVRHHAAWLVADERMLRRIAKSEGIATIGTLGLLAAAVRRGLLSKREALADLDTAISSHNFRISIALYQRFQAELRGR
jgi:predicted nucleic acid-binding protein